MVNLMKDSETPDPEAVVFGQPVNNSDLQKAGMVKIHNDAGSLQTLSVGKFKFDSGKGSTEVTITLGFIIAGEYEPIFVWKDIGFVFRGTRVTLPSYYGNSQGRVVREGSGLSNYQRLRYIRLQACVNIHSQGRSYR